MKKFFSLFAAVLFAGSMMAATAMTCAEAKTAAEGGSTEEATITGYVTKIQEAWSSHKNISFWMADTKDGGEVFEAFRVVCETAAEAPAVGDKVQVTGTLTLYKTTPETAAGGSFVILEKAEEGGGEGGGSSLTDPTNCAEAAEAALSVSKNNDLYNGGKSYTIEGYVTSIATAYNDTYHNISFWMADTKTGGNVLEAFRAACASADDAPNVGDKVKVTGTLTKYGATPEFSAGCTFVITEADVPAVNLGEKTIAEFLSLKNTKDTCILKGIVENIKMDKDDDTKYNAYGNFDLTDETGTVYVYGLLTPDGEAQKFIEMGIEAADTVIVKAVYFVYNDEPQAKDAILVEHIKPAAVTPVYSYDYEPTEKSNIDVTFKGRSYNNQTETTGSIFIYLTDNEEGDYDAAKEWLTLEFFTSTFDEKAGIAAGTYQINNSKDEGTFFASPGGDEDYDYGCTYGIYTSEVEYNPYYLISGTVTIGSGEITVDALSYHGSKIKASYIAGEALPDPTTCAEAADAALSVSEDNEEYNGGKEYSITGYVTSIANAWDKSKITFWMADAIEYGDVLEAFRCAITDAANVPNYGDKVTVTGKLTKYGSIPEFKSGCTCVIVETGTVTLPDPTTCSEAAEYVLKYISKNDDEYNGGLEYKLTGYVTAIEEEYLAAKGNLSFWLADTEDGGNVLEAFRCVPESEDKLPKVGDKVEVTGKLTRYGTKAEFAKGCSCVIKEESLPAVNLGEKTIAQFLELKNIKDTCVLTGIVKNIVIDEKTSKPSVYGNFDLEDSTGKVFIYGLLTADGEKQKFLEMDIEENDELTLKAIYHDTGSKVEAVNAIYVSHKKNMSTAIDNTDEAVKAIKTFENGRLVIIKNGVKYNATGAVIR